MNRITVVATIAFAVTASACGGGGDGAATGQQRLVDGGTLTIAIAQDPGNLDPQNTVLSVDGTFASFGYDTMVYTAADGKITSGLAEKWDGSGTSYMFTMRPNVACSDGTPLKATDVAANFHYLTDPASKSPLLGLYVPPGMTTTADDAARTVTMTLKEPFPFFLIGLTSVPIVCPKGLADRKLLAQNTQGTGPYVLASAVAGDTYTYTIRPDYTWGPGGAGTKQRGMPATVVFKVVSNPSTAANLLLSGQANIADVAEADRSRVDSAHLLHHDVRTPAGHLYFNQAAGRPTVDLNVRRALTMALDLAQVGKVLTGGLGQPSQGMVTVDPKPCQGDTVTGNLPAHDPAEAARLLDQAGWRPGPDGIRVKDGAKLSLSLLYKAPDTIAAATELAVSQWKAVGVAVTANGKPSTQLSSTLFGTGDWDISLAALTVALPSQLVPFLSGAEPPNGTNFAHIRNADYTRLSGSASVKSDTSGCPDWIAAEVAVIKAVDVVPFYDKLTATYAKNTTFELANGGAVVTSFRLLAG